MAEDRSDDHCDPLMPILVVGYGRVGSTALMALLGTDERVAFDRRYPFEHRYVTYVAKLSLLAAGPGGSPISTRFSCATSRMAASERCRGLPVQRRTACRSCGHRRESGSRVS